MIGALTTTLMIGLFAGFALAPPRPRHSTRFSWQFALTWWLNELPMLGIWWLVAGATETLLSPSRGIGWWIVTVLVVVDVGMLAWLLLRARSVRPALSRALRQAYGPGTEPRWTRAPWWRILLLPVVSWRPDVRRIRNRRYGSAHRRQRLDVYVSRRRRPQGGAPVLIYLHPGGFIMGSRLLGSHPLFYRLAADGWICMSADYRLRTGYGEQLADARSAIEWARAHAADFGGEAGGIIAAGGSAGAHLVTTAALSGADVQGVVAMYGYYGAVDHSLSTGTSPVDYLRADPPPFLVLHGELDTLVRYEDVRAFVDRLRRTSRNPVAYAQLPGANHNFDFFPSLRFQAVTDAIASFADLALGGRARGG